MNCRIGSANSKAWGKAIQTLISTGDNDVQFKFSNQCLTITTFESSLAVCCICSFEKEFFERYNVSVENPIACRVPSKCLLKAFRSLRFLAKSVSWCEINFQENGDVMNIVQKTKSGPSIRYKLRLSVESEALEMDCYPERLCNWIKVDPKFFLSAVANFGPTNKISDLTLKTLEDKILLKNCNTDVVKREGKIYTELSVNSVDFAEYSVRQESEITVPLREFKVFVAFAEGQKLDLSIHFESSTDPVIIVIQNEFYKATLNLATRVPTLGSTIQQMSPATSGVIGNVTSQQPLSITKDHSTSATKESVRSIHPSVELDSEEVVLAENNGTENALSNQESLPHTPHRRLTEVELSQSLLADVNALENEEMEYPELSIVNGTTETFTRQSQPPKKRMKTFRSIFPGLFTNRKLIVPGLDVILCPGSDDEDC